MSGIVGNLFGSKGTPSSSQQTSASGYAALPQNLQDLYGGALTSLGNQANNNPSIFAPAPLNADENNAADMIRQGYTNVDPNSFQSMLSTFMNPFTNDVVNTTNNQLLKANQGLLSQISGDASNAGAFGGSRMGAAQALQNQNTLNTIGATDAQLNQSGFDTATQNALNSINTNNSLKSQQQSDLGALGSSLQSQSTAEQQAPITGLATLISALQGVNSSTGQQTNTGATQDQGFLGRLTTMGAGATGLGNLFNLAGNGVTKLGNYL